MNYDNYSDEGSCLNSVNITSNVRAPGEYKYYYCGENNSASDKSFLSFSTMWYTQKISEDMFLLSSCYTSLYTCLLYFDPKKNLYNIYVYQNTLDYKSENISLKAVQLIQLEHSYKTKDIVISKSDTTGQPTININVKIYFGADNYLLLNEIDRRILLIDFFNGNYVTVFNNKESKSQEPLYNIIDTYNENYYLEGEPRVRTYAFLSIKYQEKKISYYKYRYFIIERGILENNYFFLHSIDLDMGVGEPLGLKIARIPKQSNGQGDENKGSQWFYIFCFLSSQRLYQLITNYDKLTLYQMLRAVTQCNTIIVPSVEAKVNSIIGKCSMTTIGLRKDSQLKIRKEEDNIYKDNEDNTEKNNNNNLNNNDNINNDNNNSNIPYIKISKIAFWSTSINLWLEKKQIAQSVKIFLNINTKKLCALILFFEIGNVVTFPFNYNDSPEEIKNKIIITNHEIQLDKIKSDSFGAAKIYNFEEHYFFKSNTICALSSKNLILAIDNKLRIYDLDTNKNLFSYSFYKENIASFLLFDDIGSTFLLTWTKVFKIIFNIRYKIFTQNEILNNPNCHVNNYQQEGMCYPIFEYKPEDVWNSYCSKLEIDSNNNKAISNIVKINNISNNSKPNTNTEGNLKKNKICEICSKDAEYYCSDCELRNYCCNEHFQYDYNSTHFFECQLVQFFKRKDIMNIENKETRYIVLYNELIKLCGRILNFMFTRIFVGKDCHLFLEMLLNLITLLENFGFNINFSEFCCCNLFSSNDKYKQKPEKILFFQECIYFYVQLQILKCTFTSKCRLYNLSDCYMKIIKNDIIPKLTPKTNKRLNSLRCEKLKKELIFNNEFFLNFQSPVFFDLKKVYSNADCTDYIDIVENYIMKHLMALSILVKFKIKLHSSIDVKDTFVDISLMFDDHFRENKSSKNVAQYCYFSISFYLVEIGKVPQTVKLLKKMVTSFNEKSDTKLKALTFYNLGVLQYALGEFKIGIHNIEVAYKLIVDFCLSEKFKHKVIVTLGLAYLNQRNLFKAYVLIQTSIRELKKIRKQKYELKCIKLNVYLNYIIDLYEYSFITKARLQTNKNKKDKNYNIRQLINFVEGGDDKELIVIEQHVTQFLKVVEYIWNLPTHILQHLQTDNPPKPTINYREEIHHEKNLSFTMEQSQMSTFLIKETGIEREESQEEYDEDIEVKPQLFDSLTRQQQKEFKELKTVFLKRDIILRDSLGAIEKFNINYDPLYSVQFQKIVEKLKSNFLLKEIFYCFQNEKWRDELYNYSPNNVLFGLSKYLKLEKIKNVIAIEKSKCLDIIKKEKIDSKDRQSINRQSLVGADLLKKINIDNNIYPNNNNLNVNSLNNALNLGQNNTSSNNLSLFSRYKNEDMNYLQFKKKFFEALKESEKNKNDSSQFINLKDDYLVSLYKNVYLNNPEHDFIFQNPSLILNYIFIDISSNDTFKKEANELIQKQKSQEEENNLNKLKNRKSNSFIGNKYNNSDSLKEEDTLNKLSNNKFSSSLNNVNILVPNKDQNELFDHKSKIIISPILENINDQNNNYNYNKTSSDTKREYNYFYLKFDNKEDNLTICSKVCEYLYCFIRKKQRSATSSWAGRFISAFGKKKKVNERKSILPDLFLKLNTGKKTETSKKKLSANTATNDNYKEIVGKRVSMVNVPNKHMSVIGKLNIRNENSIKRRNKRSSKEPTKSCKNLHDRLSVDFNLESNDIEIDEKDRLKLFSDSDDDQSSGDENIIQKKISLKDIDNENEHNNNISKKDSSINTGVFEKKKTFKININKNNNNLNNSISKKDEKIDNNIKNNNDVNKNNKISENNNEIINNKNSNNILKRNDDNELFNLNSNDIKNKRSKINKKNEITKHNSVKQFNNNNNFFNNNIIDRITTKKNKNLMINTKKTLVKPKTYNYFSPEQLKKEEESINNFNGKQKIVYSMSQKKFNKYGYRNKEEQEMELVHGAIEYLQHEYNQNRNKKNKNLKDNHMLNSNGITIGTLQNKIKYNEKNNLSTKNKNNYKVPNNYKKKGKQIGEESTISLNSTSSGFKLNNNNSSYGDTTLYMDKNNESDLFQKEMPRIINFNKKLKSNGKDNNYYNLIYNNKNNNFNKKMNKSNSQPNFFQKKNMNIFQNGDKNMYYKDKPISKTNNNFTPLSNISKNNTNKTPNHNCLSSNKNCCLNNNNINTYNNINNSKFIIKSNQNKKNNISKNNVKSNKENNQKYYIDYYQDEQEHFLNNKKKEDEKEDYNDKTEEKYEYEIDNRKNNRKFRYVLDKYVKKQKKRRSQKNSQEKNQKYKNEEDNQIQNNEEEIYYENNYEFENKLNDFKDEQDNNNDYENNETNLNEPNNNQNIKKFNECINLDKGENSGIVSSIGENNIKEKNNNEKTNDSFFNEGINIENLCNLKENNNEINNNIKYNDDNNNEKENKINFENEKSNRSYIKQKSNTNLNSKNSNKTNEQNEMNFENENKTNINEKNIENTNNVDNNEINNKNSIVNSNSKINNISLEKSNDSSCNGLGEDTDIKGKINTPFYVTPIIRKASQRSSIGINNIDYLNLKENKKINDINTSKKSSFSNISNIQENNPINNQNKNMINFDNIINQTHERPQNNKYKKIN